MKITNSHIILYEPPTMASVLTKTKLAAGELIRAGDWVGSPVDFEILKVLAAVATYERFQDALLVKAQRYTVNS